MCAHAVYRHGWVCVRAVYMRGWVGVLAYVCAVCVWLSC